jgi:hypothetical protein
MSVIVILVSVFGVVIGTSAILIACLIARDK